MVVLKTSLSNRQALGKSFEQAQPSLFSATGVCTQCYPISYQIKAQEFFLDDCAQDLTLEPSSSWKVL